MTLEKLLSIVDDALKKWVFSDVAGRVKREVEKKVKEELKKNG